MRPFFQSMAGSFVGKILAGLVIAVCVALGAGPARWAAIVIGNVPFLIGVARVIFWIIATVLTGILVRSLWVNGNSVRKNEEKASKRRPFAKVMVRHFLTRCALMRRTIRRWWRLFGPYDYEVSREIVATDKKSYRELDRDRIAFSHRFADAFPGKRELFELDDTEQIIQRLNVLLRWPLSAQLDDNVSGRELNAMPFYWTTGDGNMHLTRYCRYKRNIILLNEMEIQPKYLAAIGGNIYWRTFVYLEGCALTQHNIPGEEESSQYQEYAIYNGAIFSRREYDDGAFLVKGGPVRFKHTPDLRARNLVPLGLLLVPNSSPANNPIRDRVIHSHVDAVIADKSAIRKFKEYLLSLPKEEHRMR